MTDLSYKDLVAYSGEGKRSGKYLRFKCPVHGGDKQRSLSLDPQRGYYRCFNCGASGFTAEAKAAYRDRNNRGGKKQGSNPRQGVIIYRSSPGPERRAESNLNRQNRHAQIEGWLTQLRANLKPQSLGGWYLQERGFSFDFCQKMGIGYADYRRVPFPHFNKHGHIVRRTRHGRIVFPCTDQDGYLVNLYGRAVEVPRKACSSTPKSLRHDFLSGPKGFLFPENLMVEGCIMTEGALDALSLVMCGYKACAIFGLTLNFNQAKTANSLVLALDQDEAGQRACQQLAFEATMRGKRIEVLPKEAFQGCKDWNEVLVTYGTITI